MSLWRSVFRAVYVATLAEGNSIRLLEISFFFFVIFNEPVTNFRKGVFGVWEFRSGNLLLDQING